MSAHARASYIATAFHSIGHGRCLRSMGVFFSLLASGGRGLPGGLRPDGSCACGANLSENRSDKQRQRQQETAEQRERGSARTRSGDDRNDHDLGSCAPAQRAARQFNLVRRSLPNVGILVAIFTGQFLLFQVAYAPPESAVRSALIDYVPGFLSLFSLQAEGFWRAVWVIQWGVHALEALFAAFVVWQAKQQRGTNGAVVVFGGRVPVRDGAADLGEGFWLVQTFFGGFSSLVRLIGN